MDIRTFVSEALMQITGGVEYAVSQGVRVGVDPGFQKIEEVRFDMAVTVNEEQAKEGAGGIQVLGVKLGGQLNAASSTSSVSRIQFSVPILLPRNPKG